MPEAKNTTATALPGMPVPNKLSSILKNSVSIQVELANIHKTTELLCTKSDVLLR